MQRRATILALVFVGLGIVLGTTVLRSNIAQATGLASTVTVSNTPSQAVPVREQNLAGGNIKVHEQGTANVNVTNSSLSIAEPAPVTAGGNDANMLTRAQDTELGFVATASALVIHLSSEVDTFELYLGDHDHSPLLLYGPQTGGNADVVLSLTRPISFDRFNCFGGVGGRCVIAWVGTLP